VGDEVISIVCEVEIATGCFAALAMTAQQIMCYRAAVFDELYVR